MSDSGNIPTLAELQRNAHEYLKSQRWEAARQILTEAAVQYPDSADVFSDLAAAERALGHLNEAITHYQKALELDPKLAFVHNNLGKALTENGQLKDAIDCFHRSLVLQPRYPSALNNLSNALMAEGRLDEAERSLERLFRLSKNFPGAQETLASLRERQGRFGDAIQQYLAVAHQALPEDKAKALWAFDSCRRIGQPSAEIESNRCALLLQMQRPHEARDSGALAVQLEPNHIQAHLNLGVAYNALNDPARAAAHYRRSTELDPRNAGAWIGLGRTLGLLGDYEGGGNAFHKSLELDRNNPQALTGLGTIHQGRLDLDRAESLYRHALSIAPNFPDAHYRWGAQLAMAGRLRDGLREMEWRRGGSKFQVLQKRYPGAGWAGEDVNGKTIVLYREAGAGDVLQFVRFARFFKSRGARVAIDCGTELHRLLLAQPYVDVVFASESEPLRCDFHAPLASLPHLLNVGTENLTWEGAYLQLAEQARDPALGQHTRPRVGIVWAGSPAHRTDRLRSIALDRLQPLIDNINVDWVSLQVGPNQEALQHVPLPIRDLGSSFTDFADTAKAVAALDLIISVDTALAHLAGAMGRPCWMLLPFCPDWRWMLQRADSPWYPSLRLYRQTQPDDWSQVVAAVRQHLEQWLASREASFKVSANSPRAPFTAAAVSQPTPINAAYTTDPSPNAGHLSLSEGFRTPSVRPSPGATGVPLGRPELGASPAPPSASNVSQPPAPMPPSPEHAQPPFISVPSPPESPAVPAHVGVPPVVSSVGGAPAGPAPVSPAPVSPAASAAIEPPASPQADATANGSAVPPPGYPPRARD